MPAQSFLHPLLRASREMLILVDPAALTVTDVNPFTCEILGHRAEEMIGRPITDFECALQDVFYWDEVSSGNFSEQTNAEGLYACANGDFLPVEKSVSLLSDLSPPRIAICARDARASVSAALELSKTTSILQATFESTAEGFLVIDRAGMVLNYNRRFMEIWGLDVEGMHRRAQIRLLARVARMTPSPGSAIAKWRALISLDDGEETTAIELRDGRTIRCRSCPLMMYDQIEGRVISFTDITERINRERELAVARDVAAASAKAKADFLAMMSHEIRTPLTGILGMTELILETDLLPLQREYLDLAHSSAASLLTIINDILDFSRIEAGKLKIEAIPFDLIQTLMEATRPLCWQAKQRGNRLEFDFPEKEQLWLLGDPTRIQQIVINLVGNAIKFTENGKISIRLEYRNLASDRVDVRISVRDTGIGIPPEKMELIFEAFTQSDSSITRRFGGTGLGLSISNRLAHLMGGRVAVQSLEGQGSCFSLALEMLITSPAARCSERALADSKPAKKLSILLAEDTLVNQVVISTMLHKAGHEVVICNNGEEAVKTAVDPGARFNAILMDVQMPVMDGFTATRHLREQGITLPIIALTAHAIEGFREKCLASGMNDYLPKPIDSRLLLEKLGQLTPSVAAAEFRSLPDGTSPEGTAILDVEGAIDRIGGEQEIYLSLLEMVDQQISEDLRNINDAKEMGDLESLAGSAHRLKGSLGAIGATCAHSACRALELSGKQKEAVAIPQLLENLQEEIARLRPLIAKYKTER